MFTTIHRILFVTMLGGAALTAFGQRPSKSGIGVKGGFQLATLRVAEGGYKSVPGGVIGAYAPMWITPHFELQLEVLASAQGTLKNIGEDERYLLRTFYAQVPFSGKLYLSDEFNVQGGVQGGYLLAGFANGVSAKDQFAPVDFGFNIGLGLDSRRGFDLTMRYYSGMANVYPANNTTYPTNRTLQLTGGYRFKQFSQRRIRRH